MEETTRSDIQTDSGHQTGKNFVQQKIIFLGISYYKTSPAQMETGFEVGDEKRTIENLLKGTAARVNG